ncbi:hypothetical protein GS458_1257 [Geobacillus stearothermophilus]|nr:hypothetical protein GS458_1257 [Geobacillus stearothermophilus]
MALTLSSMLEEKNIKMYTAHTVVSNDIASYSFEKQREDDITYEDEPPREIKLVKVDGTYGTYRVEEKMKPSDVVGCALLSFYL